MANKILGILGFVATLAMVLTIGLGYEIDKTQREVRSLSAMVADNWTDMETRIDSVVEIADVHRAGLGETMPHCVPSRGLTYDPMYDTFMDADVPGWTPAIHSSTLELPSTLTEWHTDVNGTEQQLALQWHLQEPSGDLYDDIVRVCRGRDARIATDLFPDTRVVAFACLE